jgi:hypothetical protein
MNSTNTKTAHLLSTLRKFGITATLAAALGSAAPSQAHHSFAAEFDASKPIELLGVVTKVDWTNPHVYFYIEVENAAGGYDEWALEMGSPNGLMRRGWTRNTMEIGTEVLIRGSRARDGSFKGNATTVVLVDGCRRLFAGTSQDSFNESEQPEETCEF